MENSLIQCHAVELGPCRVKLEIEVAAEKADQCYRKVAQRYARQVKLPGFRAGHVPERMLQEQFGAQIKGEATNSILQEAFREVSADYREKMVSDPMLSEDAAAVEYVAGQPLKFALEFDVKPVISLPEYKGLHLTKEVRAVTDEMVDVTLEGMREQDVKFEKVEGPTQAEDLMTVSHTAEPADGKEKPENKYHMLDAEKTWVALRKPEMYPGISEKLLGMKVGEERDVEIVYPEDHREESLRGRKFNYHFKVLEIHRGQKPELNDEFAKKVGFDTVEKLKEMIRHSLEHRMADEARAGMVKQIQDLLFKGLDFALPESQLANAERAVLRDKVEAAQRQGTKAEELTAKVEELRKEARPEAERRLREYYLLQALVAAENIQVSKEDMARYQAMLSNQKGKAPMDKLIREKQENGEVQNYMLNCMFEHLFDFIIEKAEVTEVQAPAK